VLSGKAPMISFCGIVCSECPAFVLTQAGDMEGLGRLAERLRAAGQERTAEDLLCDGCLVEGGRLVPFCRKCPARLCGLERGVPNCAHCDEFGCERIRKVWEIIVPQDARPRLEELNREFRKENEQRRPAVGS
jgi:hypothetical protein